MYFSLDIFIAPFRFNEEKIKKYSDILKLIIDYIFLAIIFAIISEGLNIILFEGGNDTAFICAIIVNTLLLLYFIVPIVIKLCKSRNRSFIKKCLLFCIIIFIISVLSVHFLSQTYSFRNT